ncbi:multidrug/hemolysin transport system permease protein [Solibacillus kalamii]|uniref:Transport permease protein n=1 Tax=Solibacillus kalamii TaxID=1748298 RepID=A0ABX3ZK55_9BACL|nr:ABC transporter permease [Solibacillus kalamii]MBM7664104.1 multidrug/hemolysin transport system permease protein [Solibacillus kalamii]OUZ40125.1 multidrug ABC transporter permease [Solibacillus kalamii]
MMMSLIVRNNKIFFRDRMLVFFSLLSVLISIGLFIVFLQKLQLDAIRQVIEVTPAVELVVSEWMIAGILTMTAMTSTLAVFAIFVSDQESKRTADFLVTSASRYSIQLSYVISSVMIGFIMTTIAFIVCEVYLLTLGAELPSVWKLMQFFGVIILGVLLSAMINLVIVLLAKSAKAFSTVNSLVGTLIGFLCAVYVPMGVLPKAIQTVIHLFPVSHVAVLLRQLLMEDSLNTVFGNANEAMDSYMLTYGVVYEIGSSVLGTQSSVLYICISIFGIAIFSAVLFRLQYK